jgi:hypothetical protein
MDESPDIFFEVDLYPCIRQILVNKPNLYVEMFTIPIYNSFQVTGSPQQVYRWVIDKQIELFREGIETAVFRRENLGGGKVKVIFGAKFPEEDLAA